MFRIDAQILCPLALHALEEARDAAKETAGRSWSARLALACLADGQDDRRPYDLFWQALAQQSGEARRAMLLSSLNSIRRRHGYGPV